MPADVMDAPADEVRLDDFRITSPLEIAEMLRRLADANVHVSLHGADGSSMNATLWTVDPQRGMVSFSLLADEPQVDALVESDEATAVGYLDSVKLQFELQDLVHVRAGAHSALNAAFPRELFRFQRRNGFRVRPMLRTTPVARLRHPVIADMQLALRVLDVSIGGCAIFLPDDVPTLAPGIVLNGVTLELDADTRVKTSLRLLHVTSLNPESGGVRLGCEMVNPGSESLRTLQRYIDHTQKRRRLLAQN